MSLDLPIKVAKPSIVTDQKFGMLHKTKVNKGRPMHLHVVRALEEQLIERIRLLAPDTDQATPVVGAIHQVELIPLAAANSRRGSGPGRASEQASSVPHRGLAAGAREEGGEAVATPDRNGGRRPRARGRERAVGPSSARPYPLEPGAKSPI